MQISNETMKISERLDIKYISTFYYNTIIDVITLSGSITCYSPKAVRGSEQYIVLNYNVYISRRETYLQLLIRMFGTRDILKTNPADGAYLCC